MLSSVSFTTLAIALETWDSVSHFHPNAEEEFGRIALERLFELEPKAKSAFGCTEIPDDKVNSARIATHAKAFWCLFDSVFLLLGPDQEFIQEILKQVGLRHKAMGVNPCWFPYVGEALLYAMETLLRRPLSLDQRDAWDDVFEAVSNEMTQHMTTREF